MMTLLVKPIRVQLIKRSAIPALLFTGLWAGPLAIAQEDTTPSEKPPSVILEEIVVQGQKSWEGHDGMDAFLAGDYEKAEIEFEQEFKSLKRGRNALYNAAVDASNGIDRANNTAGSFQSGTQAAAASGGGSAQVQTNTPSSVNSGSNANYNSKRAKGRNILNDGKVTDKDFALTKYMAGLSELQQRKYAEAKKSLKTSVHYDRGNHDARMRLGLLYIVEGDIDKSADQLEALDKQRAKCKKKNCEEYDEIVESASTLATSITNAIKKLELE